jgi:hypothetical protein
MEQPAATLVKLPLGEEAWPLMIALSSLLFRDNHFCDNLFSVLLLLLCRPSSIIQRASPKDNGGTTKNQNAPTLRLDHCQPWANQRISAGLYY